MALDIYQKIRWMHKTFYNTNQGIYKENGNKSLVELIKDSIVIERYYQR